MKHKHHIIPKHMGGTDDPENIVELTIEEHAEAHRILYEKYGKWQDKLAWKGLSGQINKEDIIKELLSNAGRAGALKAKEMKVGIHTDDIELKKYWASLQPIESKIKGGKTSGKINAESGHCKNIAHLGGKASAGMKFWYNSKTDEETRSFECPGEDWERGVKMDRINIDQLRKQSSNRENSFWIHNPNTGESKMIFEEDDIPNGFIKGRKNEIKNKIDLLNVGYNSNLKLEKIKSEFNGISFSNYYNRWYLEFKIKDKFNKITNIDYWTLVWARDVIINFYNLNYKKSNLNFSDSFSKNEVTKILKSFREYLKIKKILKGDMKKSKIDHYQKKLKIYEPDYLFLLEKRNLLLNN